MRRTAVILFALIVGTAALPATAEPGVYAEAGQLAEADWIVLDSRTHGTFYFAAAMRAVSPAGAHTFGVIGSGECNVSRGKNWTTIVCEGSGRAKELGLDQFEFDPALRSASLTMRAGGVKNTVSWTGRGPAPSFGASVYGGGTMVGADAGIGRMAKVDARILGRRMPRGGWMNFAFLVEGAGAFAYEEGRSSRSVELAPDGSYSYSVELKVPRTR